MTYNFRGSRGPNDWKWEVPGYILIIALMWLIVWLAKPDKNTAQQAPSTSSINKK